ncbi:hypothetical protein CLOP_g8084, partial [Closterium sp. NIES-67]
LCQPNCSLSPTHPLCCNVGSCRDAKPHGTEETIVITSSNSLGKQVGEVAIRGDVLDAELPSLGELAHEVVSKFDMLGPLVEDMVFGKVYGALIVTPPSNTRAQP